MEKWSKKRRKKNAFQFEKTIKENNEKGSSKWAGVEQDVRHKRLNGRNMRNREREKRK